MYQSPGPVALFPGPCNTVPPGIFRARGEAGGSFQASPWKSIGRANDGSALVRVESRDYSILAINASEVAIALSISLIRAFMSPSIRPNSVLREATAWALRLCFRYRTLSLSAVSTGSGDKPTAAIFAGHQQLGKSACDQAQYDPGYNTHNQPPDDISFSALTDNAKQILALKLNGEGVPLFSSSVLICQRPSI